MVNVSENLCNYLYYSPPKKRKTEEHTTVFPHGKLLLSVFCKHSLRSNGWRSDETFYEQGEGEGGRVSEREKAREGERAMERHIEAKRKIRRRKTER